MVKYNWFNNVINFNKINIIKNKMNKIELGQQ